MSSGDMDDPDDVFEINDFTVVTELERFVVSIEAILQEWSLAGPRPDRFASRSTIHRWDSKCEKVQFGEGNYLRMSYYWPDVPTELVSQPNRGRSKEERHLTEASMAIVSPEGDFCHRNNITAMYGATEYIVFSPWDSVDDQIVTEDQKNTILSALRVAALGSECEIPLFLQYGHVDRQLFFGVMVNRSMVTLYESSHLRKGQPRHLHLGGLMSMFKEKVNSPVSTIDADDVRVSVQFEYVYKEPEISRRGSIDIDSTIDVVNLPFGTEKSALDEFVLIANWPNLKEEMINENDVYSDLDPINAFFWSASARFLPGDRILTSALRRLLHLPRSKMASDTAASLLGISGSTGIRAFGSLTDGGTMNSLRIGPSASITNPSGITLDEPLLPLAPEAVSLWMKAVFNPVFPTDLPNPFCVSEKELTEGRTASVFRPKSSPESSVTYRFGVAFGHTLVETNHSPTAFAQMWTEFVSKLRYYYEHNMDIPGMSSVEYPDLSSCLLHQKIEMLQCCISARKKRHRLYDTCNNFGNDEFYDAEEDMEESPRKQPEKSSAASEPSGRLSHLPEAYLMEFPQIPLFVPITQDRSPMTEDMVDAHTKYLSSLTDGQERVEAQLDTLKSDMQAFKAANPQCCIEDFIRWHSPKDVILDPETDLWTLSERMQLPDNAWVKCWNNAQPVPVIHQARLFNESKLAEEILSWLENASVHNMTELVRPIIFTAAVLQMKRHEVCVESLFDSSKTANSLMRATQSGLRDDYLECLKDLKGLEKLIVYYQSIQAKLDMSQGQASAAVKEKLLHDFILNLLEDFAMDRENQHSSVIAHGVPIFGGANGDIGAAVRNLMQTSTNTHKQHEFPAPHRRQYTIRWLVPRPKTHSRTMPQRLFASIEEDEYRLCGSFSEDTTFR